MQQTRHYSAEACLPKSLVDAIGRGPEEGFGACAAKLGEPCMLGMATADPYRGAPIHGYIVKTKSDDGPGCAIMNCFMVPYACVESGRFRTDFLDTKQVLELAERSGLVCLNHTFVTFLYHAKHAYAQAAAPKEPASRLEVVSEPIDRKEPPESHEAPSDSAAALRPSVAPEESLPPGAWSEA